ncbi:malto-oligosyltrehalose synthase [Mesorhizobium sp. ES1-1]|uniref:malto-oligosyltrehalose synthase n=1 Tax=Mesorhizobium sp. ES1-1 TaxID=2876629 RepID=UPI001CCD2B98|nr:malto-oligosyltrehalose synthase [Mesorhizobium sp. ES1-1]MBZ9674455.1 malto-oligosyltrehalose synthase [Mesorhizobium sp. ES1-1]
MTLPRATYRLQFRNGMDFDRAVGIVPYLQSLGISHLYASPIFTAAAGSTHGYDVANHNEIDPALGGRQGFDRLSSALKRAGLGLILDIVPNHMAAALENPWWRDVVEWGSRSLYHRHFDIDWSERLTLPILGRPYEEALATGELSVRLDRRQGGLVLAYFDHHLPLSPSTYQEVLAGISGQLAADMLQIASTARPEQDQAWNDALEASLGDSAATSELEDALAQRSDDSAFVDATHAAQPWRLLYWKDARRHLNYRRFFEVTGLVGVRVEAPSVFEDVHRLTLDLVRSGQVDGLRIDHVDGLADPQAYLQRLRQEIGSDTFLVVEKILARGETLPANWPIEGTTGYEFIGAMGHLFVDHRRSAELDRVYAARTGRAALADDSFATEARAAKRLMVTRNFETELSALAGLASASARNLAAVVPDLNATNAALTELIAAFPIYRTYGTEAGMPPRDRELLFRIADEIQASGQGVDAEALRLLLQLLSGDVPPTMVAQAWEFRKRFQQLTGPVMAKAVEDTVFYRHNRLIGLNEVGGDPSGRSASLDEIHGMFSSPDSFRPAGLLATSTHDTKRGEDGRARLYALSEAPTVWGDAVERWRQMHSSNVEYLADGPAPDPDTEWMIYQALAGTWPAGTEPMGTAALEVLSKRFEGYVEKALREAKLRTDWADVNEPYESAAKSYAAGLLSPANRDFLDDFSATLQPFIRAGAVNGLAQTLIKMTAPGIPDFYQGAEGLDQSLVDPDNRRDIDFQALGQTLASLPPSLADASIQNAPVKQAVIARCLAFRARHEALFARGSYVPLQASGERKDHVFAFMRAQADEIAVIVVPRLVLRTCPTQFEWCDPVFWGDTTIHLPEVAGQSDLTDRFTGMKLVRSEEQPVAAILSKLPISLLAN